MKLTLALTAISAFFAAGRVAAQSQPQIDTPASIVQCQPVALNFRGGSAPYFISIIPGGQTGAAPIQQFPQQAAAGTLTWTANIPAGTSISFSIRDGTGLLNYSQAVTIQAGDSGCLGSAASVSGVAASPSSSATAATSASSRASSATASAASRISSASSSVTSLSGSLASSLSSRASSLASSVSSVTSSLAAATSTQISSSSSSTTSMTSMSTMSSPSSSVMSSSTAPAPSNTGAGEKEMAIAKMAYVVAGVAAFMACFA